MLYMLMVNLLGVNTGIAHTVLTFDAHCYHMGTAIKHPVPDRVKQPFVIFDTWATDAQG